MNEQSQLESRIRNYGATSETDGEGYDTQSYGDDTFDDLWQDESDMEHENHHNQTHGSSFYWFWERLKSSLRIIANVENLWDSDMDVSPDQRRRNHLVVLFWFFILALSYAGERSTFKLLVDRTAPFRLLTVEAVTAAHAFLLGIIVLVGYFWKSPTSKMKLGIPLIDVGVMALLDTLCILLVFVSGYRVPPTLTVILVQFTLPLTAFLTQFGHPDGMCSLTRKRAQENRDQHHGRETNARRNKDGHNAPLTLPETVQTISALSSLPNDDSTREGDFAKYPVEGTAVSGYGGLAKEHVWGSLILFLAVMFALLPAFVTLIDPNEFMYADSIPTRTAINTLLYVSSCIPAAVVTLYKEHVFLQYKQPVNMNYLNLLLATFQFIVASVMSPLLFVLQGLGAHGDWTEQYPSSQFSENYSDGLRCFFGSLSEKDQESKYPESASCDFSLLLVIIHVSSVVFVGVAVDKIVNAGATKVMYRGVSAGIIVSVLCMHFYDMNIPDFNYGPVIDGLNLFCLILLILGSEVYHRVTLQDSTFETEYAPIENIYE